MQHTFRTKTLVTKGGKVSIKGLPFRAVEPVEVTVHCGKKSTRAAKDPLRGNPVIYRDPFRSAATGDWEPMR